MGRSSCCRRAGTSSDASGSTTWTSSGRTRTIRSRSSSGTRTASGVTSASRTTTTGRRPHLRDGVDRLRHVVRAVSRPGERARPGVRAWRERSRRRRAHDRQADAPRSQDEQHDLRAVSLAARHRRAWIHGWRELLRLLPAGARVRTAQGTGSDLLGRRPPAPFLERRVGPLAERVLPARRRDLHELPPRSARARRRQERTAGAGATTRCAPVVTRTSASS